MKQEFKKLSHGVSFFYRKSPYGIPFSIIVGSLCQPLLRFSNNVIFYSGYIKFAESILHMLLVLSK